MSDTIVALNMAEFSNSDRQTITDLQSGIDLSRTSCISGFGRFADNGTTTTNTLSNILEDSPINLLAGKISEIVDRLREADPRILAEKPNWLSRFTGQGVESKVRYRVARTSLEKLLEEADRMAGRVDETIQTLDGIVETHHSEVRQLKLHIAAGRLYLDSHPDAGRPAAAELVLDNPRERFARRLANLATILASHEMSLAEIRLRRAQAVDLLDRYFEVSQVLVPVWRRHTQSLLSDSTINPEVLTAANRAHEALMSSLVRMK